MSIRSKKLKLKNIIKKIFFKYDNYDYPYRYYFDLHRCIFIHIPKAAGTSVLTEISDGRYKRDHCKYKIYSDANPDKFDSYYKFCFVRNPFDRMVSIYNYLKNDGNKADDVYWGNLIRANYPSFDAFVLNYLNEKNIHEHAIFTPQYLFIFSHQHEIKVDFLGRFESINEDYRVIAKKLNLSGELPHINKSKAKKNSYIDYYHNVDVVNKVLSLYLLDFDLLGYKKEL